jgi:alginate O-acetyltransferase complex protein AlgI
VLFSEPSFLFYFLPAVLALHWLAGPRLRNALLLFASLLFYSWGEPVHLLILLVSIALNYAAGLLVQSAREGGGSRLPLSLGVAGNLALLGTFKYAGFLAEVLGLPVRGPALPIGISFFTFQALSYLVDVHRGEAKAQRNPLNAALYISMFPQLIAGPIVRYHDIEGQLLHRTVTREGFAHGTRRFAVGLAKKMILANTLALPADRIFDLPADHLTAPLAWLAVCAYTLQIYFDFSGYSDMAIGLGHMFGFRYRENFDHPYVSRSIREFWRRWHISLSTWFRDYLFIPLGGSRRSRWRVALNLWIVFLLCGFWHGASWSFIVWGAYHGLFLAAERALGIEATPRGSAILRRVYTLLVVMVGWVFFRAETLSGAIEVLAAMVGLGRGDGVTTTLGMVADARVWWAFGFGVLAATPWPRDSLRGLWASAVSVSPSPWLRVALGSAEIAGLALLMIGSFALLAADSYNPFIYFRF